MELFSKNTPATVAMFLGLSGLTSPGKAGEIHVAANNVMFRATPELKDNFAGHPRSLRPLPRWDSEQISAAKRGDTSRLDWDGAPALRELSQLFGEAADRSPALSDYVDFVARFEQISRNSQLTGVFRASDFEEGCPTTLDEVCAVLHRVRRFSMHQELVGEGASDRKITAVFNGVLDAFEIDIKQRRSFQIASLEMLEPLVMSLCADSKFRSFAADTRAVEQHFRFMTLLMSEGVSLQDALSLPLLRLSARCYENQEPFTVGLQAHQKVFEVLRGAARVQPVLPAVLAEGLRFTAIPNTEDLLARMALLRSYVEGLAEGGAPDVVSGIRQLMAADVVVDRALLKSLLQLYSDFGVIQLSPFITRGDSQNRSHGRWSTPERIDRMLDSSRDLATKRLAILAQPATYATPIDLCPLVDSLLDQGYAVLPFQLASPGDVARMRRYLESAGARARVSAIIVTGQAYRATDAEMAEQAYWRTNSEAGVVEGVSVALTVTNRDSPYHHTQVSPVPRMSRREREALDFRMLTPGDFVTALKPAKLGADCIFLSAVSSSHEGVARARLDPLSTTFGKVVAESLNIPVTEAVGESFGGHSVFMAGAKAGTRLEVRPRGDFNGRSWGMQGLVMQREYVPNP